MQMSSLQNYLSTDKLLFIKKWIKDYPLLLKVKYNRKTKLGDYRRLPNGHQITINHNLPEDLFFLTLTHEIAHMHAFAKYGYRIKPHGKEWKYTFSQLIRASYTVYNPTAQGLILDFSNNPKAGFFSSPALAYYFKKLENVDITHLMDLKADQLFILKNKTFKKGKKRKIKYICTEIKTGLPYLIHGLAEVKKV